MSLDEKNVETTINLITALQQRYTEIADIGAQLSRPFFWRSRDGSLELGQLTDDNKLQLTTRLTAFLDEAQVITSYIRQALAP
jgi:hypothetical protein